MLNRLLLKTEWVDLFPYEQFQKIQASNARSTAKFGSASAVSGDGSTVVIGAPFHSSNRGAAYIYSSNGGAYSQKQIIDPVTTSTTYCGHAVAVSYDGSTVAIGSYNENSEGSVMIFSRQANGTYAQTGKLFSSAVYKKNFGYSLAMTPDGNSIVVGATGDNIVDSSVISAGTVHVYEKQTDGPYTLTTSFMSSDLNDGVARNALFGSSVAVSDDLSTIVAGSESRQAGGGAFVFPRQPDNSYLQTRTIYSPYIDTATKFGRSMAMSGDGKTLLIGTNNSIAFLYVRQESGAYVERQRLFAAGVGSGDGFGHSVSMSADGLTLLIGSRGNDTKNTDSGIAYVYKLYGPDGLYQSTGSFKPSDNAGSDLFGFSVSISKDATTCVGGAIGDTVSGLNSGSAYIFK